jgi:hypothetical protein
LIHRNANTKSAVKDAHALDRRVTVPLEKETGIVRKGFMLVAASALINATPTSSAAAVEMQPGLWELTTKVDRDGVGATRPLRARCVTAENANAARTATALDIGTGFRTTLGPSVGKENCKLIDAKNGTDLMTWRLQCTGSTSAQREFTARFDSPRHYVMVTKTSVTVGNKTVTVISTTEGQYKGECPR